MIGRFNSFTRAFGPFLSGTSHINFFKFMFYNIVGGVAWAVSYALPGYIFGRSYELTSKYFNRIILGIIIIVIIYLYNFIKKKKHIFKK